MASLDVLGALKPFKAHPSYPAATEAVLREQRLCGTDAALDKAADIADAMIDQELLRRIREAKRR